MADVTDGDALDLHAHQLWLARIAASPDSWRLRATNAAGLLTAAAAATVAGLVIDGGIEDDLVRLMAVIAASGYVVAVLAYLIAGLWPPSKSPTRVEEESTGTDQLWARSTDEARPIKKGIAIGSFAAVAAVLATGGAVWIVALRSSEGSRVRDVSIVDGAVLDTVQRLCPALPETFSARVDASDGELLVRLDPGRCGDRPMAFELERADVVLSFRD